jgi:hypothetical protein
VFLKSREGAGEEKSQKSSPGTAKNSFYNISFYNIHSGTAIYNWPIPRRMLFINIIHKNIIHMQTVVNSFNNYLNTKA